MPSTAVLQFAATHTPVGFTSAAITQFDGSAEPVVRELIQNSLDAADRAGRSANVRFEMFSEPVSRIPGWDAFVSAFRRAKKDRQRRSATPSHDEATIIQRLDDAIRERGVRVLLCADNGCGLPQDKMVSLLTTGNTDKGEGGAGSYGLGHHAAFGASDLRYVLYGSRSDVSGKLRSVASGHAILASHYADDSTLLAPDGYWRRADFDGEFWLDGSEFPTEVPDLLAERLPVHDTGTAVAIVGFNGFNRDPDERVTDRQILIVAASNFTDAIHRGRLSVEVQEDGVSSGAATPATLADLLGYDKDRQRPRQAGQIAGAQAWQAWRTLREGASIRATPGASVTLRSLDPAKGEQTQVHVFRKGMWITSRAERLLKRDFADTYPFDAVIALDEGPLEALVRSAEGPEHRGLDMKRLAPEDRTELRRLLVEVADRLRDAAGRRDDQHEYLPEGFAILHGHRVRKAEQVSRPRISGGGQRKATTEGGRRQTSGGGGRRTTGTPRAGRIPAYRQALSANPATRTVAARLMYDDELTDGSRIGVRLRRVSGSDGTCEQPLPDDFLTLHSVSEGASVLASSDRGTLELELPIMRPEMELDLTVAPDVDSGWLAKPEFLELDIVKRSAGAASVASEGAESEPLPLAKQLERAVFSVGAEGGQ